ncbi:hypothetical protein HII31_03551 [Pseudocercospora fuligena]|uniref:Uncharacterized protein n=1 Tax=Pseudocercospora fuligena TaxID=685502 RepID=A0A8H6RQJ4_9PEZI|nr:hypothetical protein HII31_03551 [Pseudocercospora fuligena]
MCIFVQDPTAQQDSAPKMDELYTQSIEDQAALIQSDEPREGPYETFLQSISDDIMEYLSTHQPKKQAPPNQQSTQEGQHRISKKRIDKAPKDSRKRLKRNDVKSP